MDNTEQLIVNDEAKTYLLEGRKWMKFIAILGFISIGFMVLFALVYGVMFGTFMASMPISELGIESIPSGVGVFIALIYIVIAALMTPPYYYLYKFTDTIKTALLTNDSNMLATAFGNLKSRYKYLVIMIISIFVIYIFMLIIAMITAASFAI